MSEPTQEPVHEPEHAQEQEQEHKEEHEHHEDEHEHHEEQKHDEVPFDPEAKPAKGILVKPGHKREKKSVGGVKVADDAPEKEAGQRKKYDMHKVEGREGVMVRKKSVGALLRPKHVPVVDKGEMMWKSVNISEKDLDSPKDSNNEDKKDDEKKDEKEEKEEKKEEEKKEETKDSKSKKTDKKKK